MAKETLVLCECCALKLTNDDESACREFHGHTHRTPDVPADTVVSQGPHVWDGTLALTCHGHDPRGEDSASAIHNGQTFWVAEVMS